MAKTVSKREIIDLLDGTSVTLRPLSITRLGKFLDSFDESREPSTAKKESASEGLETLMELARQCLEQDNAEVAARDDFGDLVDIDTVYKIIEVCGGIKLNDPNLVAAAEALLQSQA